MLTLYHWIPAFLLVVNLIDSRAATVCKVHNGTQVDCTKRDLVQPPWDIPTDATDLDLSGNQIRSLPSYSLHSFKKLQSLNLYNNKIQHIGSTSLRGLHRLLKLTLELNKISMVAPKAFKDLSNLQELDLSHNNLTAISDGVFSSLENLKLLRLSNNKLTTLPTGTFQGLVNLQILFLDRNSLIDLTEGVFQDLKNLKSITLEDIKMSCFPTQALHSLNYVEEINFSQNTVDVNCSDINLKHFQHLKTLRMYKCQLQDAIIKNIIFADTAPYVVDLSSNSITSGDPGTFTSLKNVTNIDLKWNRIDTDSLEKLLYDFNNSAIRRLKLSFSAEAQSSMGLTTLKGLKETKLATLELHLDHLSFLPSGVFQWLPFLEDLNLGLNALRHIATDAFLGLHNLKTLRLNNNQIESLHWAFRGLNNIEMIDLKGNRLHNMTQLLQGMDILSTLKFLNISHNEFAGQIPPNISDKLPSLVELDLSDNSFTSFHHDSFHSLIHLERLLIPNNNIKTLPEEVLLPLVSLKKLVLNGNVALAVDQRAQEMRPFRNCKNLKELMLPFYFAGFLHLEDIPNLQHLHFDNANFEYSTHSVNIKMLLDVLGPLTLNKLRIANMEISSYTAGTLIKRQFVSIQKLSLFNVKFRGTSDAIFFISLFPNVKSLSLYSVSGITSLNHLPATTKLEYFYLTSFDGQITDLSAEFLNAHHSLQEVSISTISLDCSACKMKDFLDWVKSDKTGKLKVSNCNVPNKVPVYNLDLGIECNRAFIISVPIICVAVFLIVCIVLGVRLRWHVRYLVFLGKLRCGGYQLQINDDNDQHKNFDAFVCYNENDREWVWQHLVPNLENVDPPNFTLCLHERNFIPGVDIFENILDSIEKSHKTMLVLSPHFAQSEWCYFEMRMAQNCLFDDKRDVLILVLLDEIPDDVMPRVLRKMLMTKEYITWADNGAARRLFWEKLKVALRSENRVNRVANM